MQCNITVRKKDKGYQCIVSYKDGNRWRQKSKQGFETQKAAKIHAQTIIDKLKKTITATDDSLKNITLMIFLTFILEKTSHAHLIHIALMCVRLIYSNLYLMKKLRILRRIKLNAY